MNSIFVVFVVVYLILSIFDFIVIYRLSKLINKIKNKIIKDNE